jgi:BTB/POZ domain
MDSLPKVALRCEFKFDSLSQYKCKVIGPSMVIRCVAESIVGEHKKENANSDVVSLAFQKLTVLRLPYGLGIFYPQLTKLNIFECGLKEITSQNLLGLVNLTELWANDNHLRSLPDDLFTHTRKLIRIDFSCNKLEFLSSNLLNHLDQDMLEVVDFRLNKIVDAFYYPGHNDSVKTIDALKRLIDFVRPFPIQTKTLAKPVAGGRLKMPGMESTIESTFVPVRALLAMKIDDSVITEPALSTSPSYEEILKLGSKFSDFTIVAGAGSRNFHVHKCVLAVQSSVFALMLENDEQVKMSNELEMKGYEEESVEEFLYLLYTNRVKLVADPLEVYCLASTFNYKFVDSELKTLHKSIASCNIKDQNLITALKLGNLHNSMEMIETAFKRINEMIPFVLSDRLKHKPEKVEEILEKFLSIKNLVEEENSEIN